MDFESHIQATKPVVVEFFAGWNPACDLLIPVIQEIKETAGDRATVLCIDVDKEKGYAEDYQVYTVPTLMIFKDGHMAWRKDGISSSHEVLEHLNLLLD
jgi:thioredoxin 1